MVNQLQNGPRSTASLILQLLSILAQHNQHQEDLLKCGVVPTLLMLYRSDDSAVALQAARIMEALSEPASTILQRSLSAGNGRLGADSSSGSSCGNTPTAAATAAGSGASGSAAALQSPYGLPPRGPLQRSSEPADQGTKAGQQEALVSSSSDSSAEYVTCNSHNSSAGGCSDTQHVAEAGSGPYVGATAAGPRRSAGPTPRQSAGAALDQGAAQPPASSSNSSIQVAGGTAGSTAHAAVAAAQQAEASAEPSSSGAHAAILAVAAAEKPSVELPAGSCSPSSSSTSSAGSPARRVAAVAAALEAAALASSSSSVDGCSASSPVPVSPGAVGRARQSSIPTLSRAASKTPSGLCAPPLLAKRPTSGKTEQPGEPLQQQQQLAVEQDHTEQPSPSTAHSLSEQQQQAQQQLEQQPNQVEASQQDQRPQQQPVQQQQQRLQPLQHQHLPSRLPRRLPHTPGSSGPHGGSSSSSSMTDPGSRTGTPDPIKRRQHPSAHHPSGGAKLPHGGSGSGPSTAGGRTSASPVHLRVLAAQKKSQRNLASAADAGDSPAPGTPSAGPPQQPFEVAGTGRVMQMAAAIVANAEAAARSASPQRLVKQPSQLQAQLQQQAQQQPQQQPAPLGQGQAGKPSSSSAAAEGTTPAGQGSSSSSNRPAGSKSPGKADGGVPAAASAPAASSSAPSPARDAAAAAAPAAHFAAAQDKLGGSHAAAAAIAGPPPAAEADDLLSSTYDNLHGLLLKKSDIEVCRCVALVVAPLSGCSITAWLHYHRHSECIDVLRLCMQAAVVPGMF